HRGGSARDAGDAHPAALARAREPRAAGARPQRGRDRPAPPVGAELRRPPADLPRRGRPVAGGRRARSWSRSGTPTSLNASARRVVRYRAYAGGTRSGRLANTATAGG